MIFVPPCFMQMIFGPSRASRHFDVTLGGAAVEAALAPPRTLLLITLRIQSGIPPTCTTKAFWLFVECLLQMLPDKMCAVPVLAYKPISGGTKMVNVITQHLNMIFFI